MTLAIYVIEDDAPLLRLAVWGLREEGYDVVSAPLPSDTTRFADQAPSLVVLNADLPAAAVADVCTALPDAHILDLADHDGVRCAAHDHLRPPHRIDDIVAWIKKHGLADSK